MGLVLGAVDTETIQHARKPLGESRDEHVFKPARCKDKISGKPAQWLSSSDKGPLQWVVVRLVSLQKTPHKEQPRKGPNKSHNVESTRIASLIPRRRSVSSIDMVFAHGPFFLNIRRLRTSGFRLTSLPHGNSQDALLQRTRIFSVGFCFCPTGRHCRHDRLPVFQPFRCLAGIKQMEHKGKQARAWNPKPPTNGGFPNSISHE